MFPHVQLTRTYWYPDSVCFHYMFICMYCAYSCIEFVQCTNYVCLSIYCCVFFTVHFATSCSDVQKYVLLHLQVDKLRWILLRLIEFRDTCYYTFCELPYALKSHPPHYTESYLERELSKKSMEREKCMYSTVPNGNILNGTCV